MKWLILSIIVVSSLFFLTQNAFAENLFYGYSSFEKLPSTVSDKPSTFELKIRYTEGPYAITKLTPVFDVSPESAKQYVQIKTKPIEGLHRNDIARIQSTMTVDPKIPHKKIFVSVYFSGTDSLGNPYKSAWTDSMAVSTEKSEPANITQKCSQTNLGAKYGKPVDLEYDIDGGNVISICKLEDTNSVITKIDAENDGKITIKIPKKFVYSLSGTNCEEDSALIVLMNNEESPFDVIQNKKDNVVTIEFRKGIHTIEIIGTWIIPSPAPTQYCGVVMGFDSLFLPPKFQIEKGMKPEQVRCNEELVLVIKATDATPACVKHETMQILIERGWAESKLTQDTAATSDKSTEGNTIVYPAFENGVTEIVNPEHESLTYHATIPVIDDTYLSKNVQQWTNAWPQELDAGYQKHRDEFYTELGRLLMKNEMQYWMNSLGIKNTEDDFKVISGISLDSLPPHIGFSTIIHATDGHYYWLQGSTLANKVSYYKTTQLQYPNLNTTDPVITPNETLPRISIQMKGNNDLKSVPSFVVLYNPGEVEFYNETPETLFISIDKDGLSEHGSEQTQEIWTRSDSGATWPFSEPGAYSWRGKIQTIIDNKEYDLSTGGGVLVLSDDMDNLSRTEQMETARMILVTSGLPIVGMGQKGEDDTLYISLDYAIDELLPESRQYYLQKAQQLIPFDIAIKLDKG